MKMFSFGKNKTQIAPDLLDFSFIFLVSPGGSLTYSKVTAFVKKDHVMANMYKSITTSKNNISLTRGHLIYARKNSNGKFSPM